MAASLRNGFTLIELLVVIAIIGVLSAIGLTSFTSAQARARDAERRAEVKSMADAFEQYAAANNGSYAAACATMVTSPQGATLLPQGLPTDPRAGIGGQPDYNKGTACATTTFCICARLEATGTGNKNAMPGSTCGTFGSGAGYDYFCVPNLQ